MHALVRLAVVALLAVFALPAQAADDPAARRLIDQAIAKNSAGFQTGQSTTAITLRLANGKEKTWKTLSRVSKKDGRARTRVTFLEPADSVGVELLMLDEAKGRTTQYLYLPKTKRLRRIGGSQKNTEFMGTDFSFGDLESRGLQVGEAKKLGQETVGGAACTRVDVRSDDPEDAYGHVELWIDDKLLVPRQMKFFDKADKHVKTLVVDKVGEIDGRATLEKFRMLNHVRNSVTSVETRDVDTKAAFPDALFEPDSLGR